MNKSGEYEGNCRRNTMRVLFDESVGVHESQSERNTMKNVEVSFRLPPTLSIALLRHFPLLRSCWRGWGRVLSPERFLLSSKTLLLSSNFRKTKIKNSSILFSKRIEYCLQPSPNLLPTESQHCILPSLLHA